MELHKLVELFIMLKINDFDQNKRGINDEQCTNRMIEIID
jgi:hypothetical protein